MELEGKVAELEKYKEQVSERQDVKDEIEAFSTQELTKVKHLVCIVLCIGNVECHTHSVTVFIVLYTDNVECHTHSVIVFIVLRTDNVECHTHSVIVFIVLRTDCVE